jgi:acyl-ACP thioesterase
LSPTLTGHSMSTICDRPEFVSMNRTARSFLAEPAVGRIYVARRLIRSSDVTSSGRLRLDAFARYLQIVAEDDLADSGLLAPAIWLVRRCAVEIGRLPMMGERITLRTFCSGTGPRWAERTTTMTGTDGDLLQARAVWVAVSPASGRPVALGEDFLRMYGEATQGRIVSARLSHPRPPAADDGRPWPLRAADFDTAGHVNNTIAWAAVEDLLAGEGPAGAWLPGRAEVEYQRAILPGCQPRLASARDERQVLMWLLDGDRALVSARLTPTAGFGPPGT